jgi:ribonuclease R
VCSAFLLEHELYESGWDTGFEGEVSGVVGGGAFVRFSGELADIYEGFLPVRLMRQDRFDLNATETALVGRRSGGAVRLGDPVRVRVTGVEAPRGRVDLEPVVDLTAEDEPPRRRPRTKRPRETRRAAQHRREGR